MADDVLSLLSLLGEVYLGRGIYKESKFHGPDRKFLPAPSNFEKTIALVFLKATSPHISY
jgi:hypothetical protein